MAATGVVAMTVAFGSIPAAAQSAPAAAPAPPAKAPAAKSAAPSSFGWYGEVVAFDAATRTLTARAKAEPHVPARAATLKAGDPVVLSWVAFNGEADAVRYVAAAKATAAESGYLVRGTLVGVDAKGQSVTFKTTVPAAVATTLSGAKAGTPVRVAAPVVPAAAGSAVTAVALGKTAPPRPVEAPVAKPVENARQMAGAWDVATNMMGNNIKLVCNFTQFGAKLGGTCNGPGPLASLPADGKIDGDDVSFGFSLSQPVAITLLHRGKLDAAGTKIEGSLDLMGNITAFVATKK